MSIFCYLLLSVYFGSLVLLTLYGLHRLFIIWTYFHWRHNVPHPLGRFESLPKVTVQLPLYNERYVTQRLMEAVARLDYPRNLLEIQVLDDSDDETVKIVSQKSKELQGRGLSVKHIRRSQRKGYKAGALQKGLRRANGDFIAIFDADFLPPPDFLRRVIDFFTDSQVGMVQARWGHLNREFSLLTQVQALLLDGHFMLEHTARNRSGRFFNFNGTGGIWRKEAIIDAGGWQYDTLTEDLDLSYRAQIKGWKFIYLPQMVVPGELPIELDGLRVQQRRWAKGSIETAKKVLPLVLESDLPYKCKLEAFFHLSSNLCYLFVAALCLSSVPALMLRIEMGWSRMALMELPLFVCGMFSIFLFYVCAERELGSRWFRSMFYVPPLMAIGLSLGLGNSWAVMKGLIGQRTGFVRTAKFGIRRRADKFRNKRYRSTNRSGPFYEPFLVLLFAAGIAFTFLRHCYLSAPFLCLFFLGFVYTFSLATWQGKR